MCACVYVCVFVCEQVVGMHVPGGPSFSPRCTVQLPLACPACRSAQMAKFSFELSNGATAKLRMCRCTKKLNMYSAASTYMSYMEKRTPMQRQMYRCITQMHRCITQMHRRSIDEDVIVQLPLARPAFRGEGVHAGGYLSTDDALKK